MKDDLDALRKIALCADNIWGSEASEDPERAWEAPLSMATIILLLERVDLHGDTLYHPTIRAIRDEAMR